MSKYSSTISYNIQTTLDASGIAKLQAEIRNVETELQRMANQNLISDRSLSDASGKLKQLRTLISSAFNSNLGMLDITKFTNGLKSANLSLVDMQKAFSTAGSVGDVAFLNTLGRLGKLDTGIKSVSRTTEKLFNTIGNTVRWGIVANGFQSVLNSAHQTVQYVRDLDTSLTNIMMVTQQSKEQMNEFAQSANEAAKALSSTTVNMTDAALVFAQQGFNTDMSAALAERSTQLANISQQDTPTTSDQITTIMNAYDFTGDLAQIDAAMDSWANVANVSAADVEELATAAQKAASTANTTGVTLDQLNAQIATIESVTREAPENIGNALKTIYSRFADISLGNTLEDGVDLGTIAETLGQVGVEVLDDEGRMNNVGDVMEQLMEVWQTLDQTQQNAISTVIAGRYQLSRFQALMNRSDLYEDYLGASENATGTADQMQDIYANSMEGRLNQLQATAEGIFNDIFNTDDFYGMIDALTTVLDLTNQWVNAIGGGGVALQGLGAIATRVFSDNIAQSLNNFMQNRNVSKQQQQNRDNAANQLRQAGIRDIEAGRNQSTIDFIEKGLTNASKMSTKQQEAYNKAVDTTIALKKQQAAQENKILQTQILMDAVATSALEKEDDKSLMTSSVNEETGVLEVDSSGLDKMVPETMEKMQLMREDTAKELASKTIAASSDLEKLRDSVATLGKEGGVSIQKLDAAMGNLEVTTGKVEALFNEDTQTGKKLNSQLNALTESFTALKNAEGTEQQEQAMKNFSETIRETLAQMQRLNAAANNGDIMDANTLYGKRNALADTDEKVAAQQQINAATAQGYDTQADIANIVNATGAVGQLAFTWQSFQSLGSLWANADIDSGEKISQTVMNLLINLPMLISGFAELSKVTSEGSFTKIADSLSSFGNEQVKNTRTMSAYNFVLNESGVVTTKWSAANTAAIASTTMLGRAAQGAAAGIRVLNSVLSVLGGPVGIIATLAITGISTALNAINQQKAQEFQELQSSIQETSDSVTKLSDSFSNFKTLYEGYSEGTNTSEELKSAADQLNETLQDQELNAYAAAGAWEEYYARLKEVNDELASNNLAQAQTNLTLAQNTANDALLNDWSNSQQAKSASWAWKGSVNRDIPVEFFSQDIMQNASSVKFSSGRWGFANDASLEEKIESIEYINNAYDELLASMSESEDGASYQAAVDFVQSYKDWASQYQEQIDSVNAASESLNSALLASYQDNPDFQYREGTSLAEYKQQLWDTGKFNSDEMIQAFVDGMMSTDAEGALELAQQSAAEQSRLSFGQGLYAKMDSSNFVTENIDTRSLMAQNGINTDGYDQVQSQILDAVVADVISQVNNSSLSEDQKQELMNGIDWSRSAEDILATVAYSAQNGVVYSQQTNLEDDSAERNQVFEKYDIDESLADTYEELVVSSTELGDRQKQLQEEVRSTEATFGDQSDEAKKARKSLDSFNDTTEDVTTDLIRTQKGLDSLSESFEENYDILKNGDATTLEYAEALTETKDAMADVLNVSSEDLSNNFILDNLDEIKKLVDGDVEALDNLRVAAGQDYVLSLYQEGNLTTDQLDYLQQEIAEIGNMDIAVGASIEDQAFIDSLNNMMAQGDLTQKEVNSLLNMIGVEPHFESIPTPTTLFSTEGMRVSGEIFGIPYDFGLPAFEITGMVDVPQIVPEGEGAGGGTGLTKKASPYKGGINKSSYKGSGGGGSGGSGGGGGSGKSYEPKKKDPIEDELDRYERVNTMLEDAENRYERLNADRERLTGFDMADAMEEEVELLNRQIALHREKLEIQKEEAQELRDELSSQYGITFDAEGFITNYATTHDRLVNEVNSLINQYNNTTTEEGQEALEEQIEDAQDALDDFNETYQRYDELWAGDLQETLNTLEDLEDQIEDIRIEMMNTSIEAVDNLQDLQESLNEFNNTFEHFGEDTGLRDAELAASNLATYFDIANESASNLYDTLIKRANDRLNSGLLSDEERQRIQQDIAMWENARKQIGAGSMEAGGTGLFDMAFNNMRIIQEQIRQYEETGTSTIFGENSADLYDAAKEAYDQATGLLSDFEGQYEDLHDAILTMIDETAESIEKRKEQYENITDELDHQREIIELIHGDEAYDQINMVLEAQNQNYLASISEMQQTLDYWKDLLENLEEGSEEWEEVNQQIMDTQSELNDLVEESLDNLQEKYENTVNNILGQWTSSAFGGTDLDWVAEEWELINRNADYYLDDVNAAYETQKLQGKYLEMLDQTDDLHIQQMITEQMKQQLGYLQDKEKLSEYDVAYANAQLEILQKRIALEEAQRNKSQMQLRRDSQGNYSYVYTADEGDISAAEGDLLDAQNNAYNLSKEQMKQTQDDSLSALQDAQQLLNDIWTNANLTLDEKTERTQTVIDSLKEYLAGTSEQLSESEKNIINDFIGMAEMMTDENAGRIEDVLEQVKDGNLEAFDIIDTRWSTALSNWLFNLEDFNLSTDDSFSQLIENSVEFQDNIDAIAGEVNQDFSDMGDTIAGVVDQTNELASSTADFINQLKSDSGVILEYENQLESMREKIADTTNEMRAYQQQVNQLQSDLTAKEQENANLSAEIETLKAENEALKNPGGAGGGGGGASNFGGSGYSQNDLAWGIAQNIWTYGRAGGWGNDPTRSGKLTGAYGSSFARQVQDIINQNWRSGNLVNYGSDKFSSYSLIGYDTGGYTGSWSDGNSDAKNGKLAYLHQKELVLNAADTENILKAVDIVRQMVQTLKSSAVTDVFSNITNSVSAQPSGETVEQNVHITAEFPAANSAAEIESALLSLNERAIQYSFRKK
jgi:TP901 family phage tail tape measure protein